MPTILAGGLITLVCCLKLTACLFNMSQNLASALGSNQVKVQVKACALSPLDLKVSVNVCYTHCIVNVDYKDLGIALLSQS